MYTQHAIIRNHFMYKASQTTIIEILNAFILKNIKIIEMVGVVMRIISFTIVSWLGPASPFMFVWVFNTTDAILLSWCSILKKDKAYTLLNVFWIIVGLIGIARTLDVL